MGKKKQKDYHSEHFVAGIGSVVKVKQEDGKIVERTIREMSTDGITVTDGDSKKTELVTISSIILPD